MNKVISNFERISSRLDDTNDEKENFISNLNVDNLNKIKLSLETEDFVNYNNIEEELMKIHNACKKTLMDDNASLSDSETDASKKYKKMRYTSNCESSKTEDVNIVFDVITNRCKNNNTERRMTRHNSEGNFDRIISFQNHKKKSKKFGKSSNSMFKLELNKKHDKPFRSARSGLLSGLSKQKHQKKQKSLSILHKFESERCISNNESCIDAMKNLKNKKHVIKKFKSNSFVDKYDFYDNLKQSDDDDDDDTDSEDESKHENNFVLKNYSCNEIIDDFMNEQVEELKLFEEAKSEPIIHNENFESIFNENLILLTCAFEFCYAKIFVPTFVKGNYCESSIIHFNNAEEESQSLKTIEPKKNENAKEVDEMIVAHILNSTDDNDNSCQITIMTEVSGINTDLINGGRFGFKKKMNYKMVPENNMEFACEEFIFDEVKKKLTTTKKAIEFENIRDQMWSGENNFKIREILNCIIDLVELSDEMKESIINSLDSEFILLNNIQNIKKSSTENDNLALKKHLSEKVEIIEVLELICEQAVKNSKTSTSIEYTDQSSQIPDIPEEIVMESEDIQPSEYIELINDLTTDEDIEDNKSPANTKINDELLLIDETNNEKLLPELNVSINNLKEFMQTEVKQNENVINFSTTDEMLSSIMKQCSENTRTSKRKKIEIKLNVLNSNTNDQLSNTKTPVTESIDDDDCLMINLNLDFAKFPGFLVGNSTTQHNGNNTQISLFCEYIPPEVISNVNKVEIFEELKQDKLISIEEDNNKPIGIIPEIIITDNECIVNNKESIQSGDDNSLLLDDKKIEEMEDFLLNETEQNDENISKSYPDMITGEYEIDLKPVPKTRARPSYLIEKNTHIFGGNIDEEDDDEFFISSGAVYQSWPYIYEPGFKLIPIIELDEINQVLSKSDNFVYFNSNDHEYNRNNSNENCANLDDNEFDDSELPTYSLKNFGINLIHTDERKREKKRRRMKSRSIDNLHNTTSKYENYYFSESSVSGDSDSDNEMYDDSSDDSESIREYEQRHAIGFSRNLNCIALNGNNKVCSHLDLLYENQNACLMNSDEQFSSNQNFNENLKKRHSSLKLGRFANSNDFLLNKKALFFSANI